MTRAGALGEILSRFAPPTIPDSPVRPVPPEEPVLPEKVDVEGVHGPGVQTAATTPPAWDPVEADRLLARLRAELARVERDVYRGRFPPAPANLAADSIAIAERLIREHEAEAARGWDAMELLRALVAKAPGIVRGDRLVQPPANA
jgi:hypothetical protein